MKEFKFSRPSCNQHIQAADNLMGRQFQCPDCNHLIRVPRPPGQEDKPSGPTEPGRT